MALAFALGALAFFAGDWLVDRRGGARRKAVAERQAAGSGAAIFVGTLLDNVPESIILGMSFGLGGAVNAHSWSPCSFPTFPRAWQVPSILRSGLFSPQDPSAVGDARRLSAVCAGWAIDHSLAPRRGRASRPGFRSRRDADHAGRCDDAGGVRARRHAVGLFTVMGFLLAAVLSVVQ